LDFLELINIIWASLSVCIISTVISSFLSAPLALYLGLKNGVAVRVLRTAATALSNTPPIVAGLIVYMLTSRSGPLAWMSWVYSRPAMVMAQILVVTPLITSVVFPMFMEMQKEFMETCKGLALKRPKIYYLLFRECRYAYASAVLIGFGRAMSEVAAVTLAGGNIRHKTRVLTTAIMLSTGKGDFAEALTLAGILVALVLFVNFLAGRLKGGNTNL